MHKNVKLNNFVFKAIISPHLHKIRHKSQFHKIITTKILQQINSITATKTNFFYVNKKSKNVKSHIDNYLNESSTTEQSNLNTAQLFSTSNSQLFNNNYSNIIDESIYPKKITKNNKKLKNKLIEKKNFFNINKSSNIENNFKTTTKMPLKLQTKPPVISNILLNISKNLTVISEKIKNISEKIVLTSEELWAISKKLTLMSEELLTMLAYLSPNLDKLSTTLSNISYSSKKLLNIAKQLEEISENIFTNKLKSSNLLLNELSSISNKLIPMLHNLTQISSNLTLETTLKPTLLLPIKTNKQAFVFKNKSNQNESTKILSKNDKINLNPNQTSIISLKKMFKNYTENSLKSNELILNNSTEDVICQYSPNSNKCLDISIINGTTVTSITPLLNDSITTEEIIVPTTEEEFRLNANEIFYKDLLNRNENELRNLLKNVTHLESFNDFGLTHRFKKNFYH